MAVFTGDGEEEVLRTMREEPPTHFKLGIKSFSLLSDSSLDKYDSGDFEAGGYKWKLRLYPKGNKSQKGCWCMTNSERQIPNTPSLVADGRARRFRASITQSAGFTRFITLEEFNDPLKGFLVDDNCVFGADVFVHQENFPSRGECLLMKSVSVTCNHSWKIKKFSELDQEYHYSDIFTAGGFNWQIQIYPEGHAEGKGKSLSLFLELELKGSTELLPAQGVYAEYQLRIMDQINHIHRELTANHWFKDSVESCGWRDFLALSSFRDQSNGYLVNDACIIEADIEFIGAIEKLT